MPPNDSAPLGYDYPPGVTEADLPQARDATPAELRADRLADPTAHGLCVTCAAEGIEEKALLLGRCLECDLNLLRPGVGTYMKSVEYRPDPTPAPLFAPPFRAEAGGIIRDRYDREVCEVDPAGILYTDVVRAEMAAGIADALNAARGGAS